jgi:hypothetical protein
VKKLALMLAGFSVFGLVRKYRRERTILYAWQVPSLTRHFDLAYISQLYHDACNAERLAVDLDDLERAVYDTLLDSPGSLKLPEQIIGAWMLERLASSEWMPVLDPEDARSEF